MAHEHHGFKLRTGFERNADHDEQAGRAKRSGKAKGAEHHRRDDRDDHEEERAKQRQAVADSAKVFARGTTRANARDKAAILLKILADLDRIKGDRGVEIREPYNE